MGWVIGGLLYALLILVLLAFMHGADIATNGDASNEDE